MSIEMSFNCSRKAGAVLLLKTPAMREDVLWPDRFAEYIKRNIRRWHEFATEKGARIDLSELILVTGCDKAAGWGVAAFTEHQRGARITFKGSYLSLESGECLLGGSWDMHSFVQHREGSPDFTRFSRISQATTSTEVSKGAIHTLPYDQCVFLRGFKCKARVPLVAPTVIEAAAEPHEDFNPPDDADISMEASMEEDSDSSSDYSIQDLDDGKVLKHLSKHGLLNDLTRMQHFDLLNHVLDYILEVRCSLSTEEIQFKPSHKTIPSCSIAIAHISELHDLFPACFV
jgi:hypothetical protein